MTKEFDYRYHSETRRSRAARSLKNLNFNKLKKDYKNDEEAFRKLKRELERLSCLAHGEDLSNNALCTELCSTVESCP